ncbi:mitochondrial ribosome-associated GTPase 1 isoform X2 [Heliangelus exortis]|uniref:mitochondrial ribosome-associated GTPase 1 isoform X2 n=1 Tax=Heliangelus exortis TaxID=472823 RepID=UPI003A94BF3E
MRRWAGALRAAAAGHGPVSGGFRERFDFGGRDVASWFPGHMAKGLRQMRASLRHADCLIEVHDARISLSGRNPMLREVLGIRPHILVFNKMDLADPHRQPAILGHLKQQGCSHVVFTDCQRDVNVKKVTGKATPVGGEPGVTKAVLTKIQVCEKPLMYIVDTPGVLPPKLGDVETGMKLALCGAIHDHLVGQDVMADYLLYALNKQQQFGYVERYGLAEACDDIEQVLRSLALAQRQVQKVKLLTGTGNVNVTVPNYTSAAYKFLRDFRTGLLGRVTLD